MSSDGAEYEKPSSEGGIKIVTGAETSDPKTDNPNTGVQDNAVVVIILLIQQEDYSHLSGGHTDEV